jgi:hypothetical protein
MSEKVRYEVELTGNQIDLKQFIITQKVYKRILWTPFENCTKESLAAYDYKTLLDSTIFEVKLGDISSKWWV